MLNFYSVFVRRCQEAGISPSVAAESAGISRSAVTKWKNGGSPTDRTIATIASKFGMSVQQFISDESGGDICLQDDFLPKKMSNRRELLLRVSDMSEESAGKLLRIGKECGLL